MTEPLFLTPPEGDATALLQDALNSAQGRKIILGAGLFLTAGLTLPSDTHLVLEADAILRCTADYEALAVNRVDTIAEESDRAIFVARGAENIRLEGQGTIEAGGEAYIQGDLPEVGTFLPAKYRPRVLVFDGCRNVTMQGLNILRSPMWTLHFVDCHGMMIRDLNIDNDRRMPNTDGIVIDSCTDVVLERLKIATADDGIVLKTTLRANGTPFGPCRNIRITQCDVLSRSCALKLGTESQSDFLDITFEECRITGSNRALGIFSRDGGAARNIIFRDITLESEETLPGFWGSGEAITLNVIDRRAEKPAGAIEDVLFERISGTMQGAVNMVADGAAGISRITLRDVVLRQQPGALGTGQSYDLRPTKYDLAPAKEATGRANAYVLDEQGGVVGLVAYPGGMPSLLGINLRDLVLENVTFERPTSLPAGWNPEPVLLLENQPKAW